MHRPQLCVERHGLRRVPLWHLAKAFVCQSAVILSEQCMFAGATSDFDTQICPPLTFLNVAAYLYQELRPQYQTRTAAGEVAPVPRTCADPRAGWSFREASGPLRPL